MPLDRLARLAVVDRVGAARGRQQRIRADQQQMAMLASCRSPALRHARVGPLRRRAAAPEDFGLDGERVAAVRRIPRFGQLPLDRVRRAARPAPHPPCRRGRTGAAPPAPCAAPRAAGRGAAATGRGSRSCPARTPHRTRSMADHAVDRRAEVELQRLAARGALDLHLVRRHPEAARQRPVVELQHEVAAAALVAA